MRKTPACIWSVALQCLLEENWYWRGPSWNWWENSLMLIKIIVAAKNQGKWLDKKCIYKWEDQTLKCRSVRRPFNPPPPTPPRCDRIEIPLNLVPGLVAMSLVAFTTSTGAPAADLLQTGSDQPRLQKCCRKYKTSKLGPEFNHQHQNDLIHLLAFLKM